MYVPAARVRLFLLLAFASAALVGACTSQTTADHATRTEVLAYLRRTGAYQPATMRVRAAEWHPELRAWLVDIKERDQSLLTSLTVNARATAYRDDTCRF